MGGGHGQGDDPGPAHPDTAGTQQGAGGGISM
jgi:hypothetical protein